MKRVMKTFLLMLLLTAFSQKTLAQNCVVIMNQDYTCDDPRGFGGEKWTLKKGDVLNVYKDGTDYEYAGPYLAASVTIPASKCHIPGTLKGERCIIVNSSSLSLREKPSANSAIYCYDEDYGGSIDPSKFLVNYKRVKGVYGTTYSWKPYYYPRGTRLPYYGKSGAYYKTKVGGLVFYLDAKSCTLR